MKTKFKKATSEIDSPAWHERVLRERDEQFKSGEEVPLGWEIAKKQLRNHQFEEQRTRLLKALDEAHSIYHADAIFSGPSVYFHRKSLRAAQDENFERFAEYVYAALASWGMHRMGPGGSKMRKFKDFRSSVETVWAKAIILRQRLPGNLSEHDWTALEEIFSGIRCMESETRLVGNSKVMAHLLPNLIPPVDRAYTLTFLFNQRGKIKNGLESEWRMLRTILEEFFYPVLADPGFQLKAREWLSKADFSDWDTSELKIVDNLIIGLLRMQRSA